MSMKQGLGTREWAWGKGPGTPGLHRPPASRRRDAGFTLIEIIVVLAVFGVFAVMAYGGLKSVIDSRTVVEASLNRTADLQRAYQRLRNDFQQLADRPARDGFGDVQPAFMADLNGIVEFTRDGWQNPLLQPRATLERVGYRQREDQLVRYSWRVLDRAQDSEPVEVAVLDRVDTLRWRYLDAQREWQESWPPNSGIVSNEEPADSAGLPAAVELTLELEDYGELRLLFASGATPTSGSTP